MGPQGPMAISGIIRSDLDNTEAPQFRFVTYDDVLMGVFDYSIDSGIPDSFSEVESGSNFIAGRVFNAVWNDIAEQVPSDGTIKPGDLAFVDPDFRSFRVCGYKGTNENFVGIVSESPGFVVGMNPVYKDPVFIALKGHVRINIRPELAEVGRALYLLPNGSLVDGRRLSFEERVLARFVGVVTECSEDIVKVFV